MRLLNREIEALLDKLAEQHVLKVKKDREALKKLPKVVKLTNSLLEEYKTLSPIMKKKAFSRVVNKDIITSYVINYLGLDSNISIFINRSDMKNKIILAAADSVSIQDVLTKIK